MKAKKPTNNRAAATNIPANRVPGRRGDGVSGALGDGVFSDSVKVGARWRG